jgi:Flp pilus assembly protein TadG
MKSASLSHLSGGVAALRAATRARLRGLVRSDRGSVAVEFVIIVPLLMLILLGFTEMYLYMRAVSTVERTAFTLADSIGQMPQVINDTSTTNANNLGAIWNAAVLIASPLDLKANGGVVITSICDSATKPCGSAIPTLIPPTKSTPSIWWSARAAWMSAGTNKTQIVSPNILPTGWPFYNGDSATVVEVFYTYNPFSMTAPFWTSAPGVQTIYKRVYVRQRSGQPLTLAVSQ